MKRHVYRDCLIVEYPDGTFTATALDADGDPIGKSVRSLEEAERWIDRVIDINLGSAEEQ